MFSSSDLFFLGHLFCMAFSFKFCVHQCNFVYSYLCYCFSARLGSPRYIHMPYHAFTHYFCIVDLYFYLNLHQLGFVQLCKHQEKVHHSYIIVQYFCLIPMLNLQGLHFIAHHFWICSLLGLNLVKLLNHLHLWQLVIRVVFCFKLSNSWYALPVGHPASAWTTKNFIQHCGTTQTLSLIFYNHCILHLP